MKYLKKLWRGLKNPRAAASFALAKMGYPRFRGLLLRFGDRFKLVNPDTVYREDYFTKRREDPWRREAHEVSEVLDELFHPESVIDFGCAVGAHLEYFQERGTEVLGVEGATAAHENALLPASSLCQHDLREPFQPPRRFDLAISFEVAEHLPAKYADTFLDSLCSASSRVVLSAAKPGQPGTHHVNLQPREYWISKLSKRGFLLDRQATAKFRKTLSLDTTRAIQENSMVFKGSEVE